MTRWDGWTDSSAGWGSMGVQRRDTCSTFHTKDLRGVMGEAKWSEEQVQRVKDGEVNESEPGGRAGHGSRGNPTVNKRRRGDITGVTRPRN